MATALTTLDTYFVYAGRHVCILLGYFLSGCIIVHNSSRGRLPVVEADGARAGDMDKEARPAGHDNSTRYVQYRYDGAESPQVTESVSQSLHASKPVMIGHKPREISGSCCPVLTTCTSTVVPNAI